MVIFLCNEDLFAMIKFEPIKPNTGLWIS